MRRFALRIVRGKRIYISLLPRSAEHGAFVAPLTEAIRQADARMYCNEENSEPVL